MAKHGDASREAEKHMEDDYWTWSKHSNHPAGRPTSGGASPVLMAGHRQVISRISKGSLNIFIYNFIITTFDCGSHAGGISARAFALARPLWRHH